MSSVTSRASKVIVLEIDLSSGKVEKLDLDMGMREKYLGGRGVNSRILYDNVGPETDALSPDNVLIFGTGAMAGTGVPTGSQMTISAKTHFGGMFYSNVGGYFAREFKKAGYDHIVVKGKAEKPVWVWIDDDKVEIRSAANLWGKGTHETDHLIKEEIGDPGVMVVAIGQAGENLAWIANIQVILNRAAAGRGGAVMGSKNLKAIAVRGTGDIELANEKLVGELSRNMLQRIKEDPLFEIRCRYGGVYSLEVLHRIGFVPVRNLNSAVFEEMESIDRETMAKYYTGSTAGCPDCPITHHFLWEIKEGPYAGEKGLGLEGAIHWQFGPQVGNSYAPSIFKVSNLINDYGIDGMESALVIAAAMEWFEKGIVTKEDLDGIELKWGDHAAIIELIHKIARREGIGDLLSEGCVGAAERIENGAKECISYAKGRTSADCDYRAMKGSYLNEVTASSACEGMDGANVPQECIGSMGLGLVSPEYKAMTVERFGSLDPLDPLSYNKARSVIFAQDFVMIMDSLEMCLFTSEWALGACTLKDAAEFFQAVTGIEMGEEDLIRAAVRIRDLERAFWVREGYTRKDDHLEGKIKNEAVQDGPFKGEKMDEVKFEKLLDEYYQLRGWDIKTGIPTREKLLKDDLADVVKDLEKRGIL